MKLCRSEGRKKARLAVVVSHAIPYYAPLYRALTKHGGIDLRVFFATRVGLDKTYDPGLGMELAWKTDLLGGYDHVMLEGAESIQDLTFRTVNNPDVGRQLAAFAPDAVLLHGYTQMTMLRALLWCRLNAVPAMMVSDSSLHTGTGAPMRFLKRLVLPLIFGQFRAFLSIGDSNQRYYETFGVSSSDIFRITNMVDEGFWSFRDRRAEERRRVRAELGLAEDDLAVLYVGKLIGRKRPGDLIAALTLLRQLPDTARPVRVLFAGSGEQRELLERAAKAEGLAAHFLGFVNIDALPGYFCAADLLVHPAEIETFGVIVLEAAILGLPLVLSDRVGAIGPTSVARPGDNTLTFPCGDAAALAAILHRLADEPETLARMSEASLRISRDLDWRMSVAGCVAALDHCLAGRRTALAPI